MPKSKQKESYSSAIGGSIKRLDAFASPVSLYFAGETRVTTYVGTFTSISLYIFLFIFSFHQFLIVYHRLDPNVTSHSYKNYFPSNQKWLWSNKQDYNWQVAFTIEDPLTKEIKDDPQYVTWVLQHYQATKYGANTTDLAVRKCTTEDYENFYPAEDGYDKTILNFRKKDALYCIDQSTEEYKKLKIYGHPEQDWDSSLGINFVPCKNLKGLKGEDPTKWCEKTKEETLEWLGTLNLVLIYNTQTFDSQSYHGDSIKNTSRVFKTQFNGAVPSYYEAYWSKHQLTDLSSYINVGQYSQQDFFQLSLASLIPSTQTTWRNNYKFIGIEFYFDLNYYTTQRQTYDGLKLTSDVGGLSIGLYLIGTAVSSWYTDRFRQMHMISHLFQRGDESFLKKRKKMTKDESLGTTLHGAQKDELVEMIKEDYTKRYEIQRYTCSYLLCKCARLPCKKYQEYNDNLRVSNQRLTSELDIINVLKAMRLYSTQFNALLNPTQIKFASKLSQQLVNEKKNDSSESSDGKEQSTQAQQDAENYQKSTKRAIIRKKIQKRRMKWADLCNQGQLRHEELEQIVRSQRKIDVRLINLYKAQDQKRINSKKIPTWGSCLEDVIEDTELESYGGDNYNNDRSINNDGKTFIGDVSRYELQPTSSINAMEISNSGQSSNLRPWIFQSKKNLIVHGKSGATKIDNSESGYKSELTQKQSHISAYQLNKRWEDYPFEDDEEEEQLPNSNNYLPHDTDT